jgi:RNA polymerase sigma-70 factor, ECF subfamily
MDATSRLCMVQIRMLKDARDSEPRPHDTALRYFDGLYGYAMARARNQAEAEDLVQDTYLRALPTLDRLGPDSNLKVWLFTILRNVWLNRLRKSRNTSAIVDIYQSTRATREFTDEFSKDPFCLYLTKVKQSDVWKAIENLPAVHREVIVLREFEELSYEEIAQILDCPYGTVMSRLSRARESLKEMLQHWSLGDKRGRPMSHCEENV